MLLQVGATTTGHGVLLEAKKGQDLTLHEGGQCCKEISRSRSSGILAGGAVAAIAGFCFTTRTVNRGWRVHVKILAGVI